MFITVLHDSYQMIIRLTYAVTGNKSPLAHRLSREEYYRFSDNDFGKAAGRG
jgi:hypothetical protein